MSEKSGCEPLYTYIDNWDGNMIFLYIVILLVTLFIFRKKRININVLIPILVAWFIISYLNYRSATTIDVQEDFIKTKKESIRPKIQDEFDNDDVINFLFSIQDLYKYNAPQYEEMRNNIMLFFKLHKITFVNNSVAHINYGLMEKYKREALNALHSVIFNMPDDFRAREKLNNATVALDGILTKYLDQISYLADEHNHKHGINNDTIFINYGSKAYNEYDDVFEPYSYEIY